MYVVNAQLNRWPSRVKADYSPNQIFYGKRHDKQSVYNVLGMDLVKVAQTEAGLEAAYNLISGNKSRVMIPNEDIVRLIEDADKQFLCELRDEGIEMDDSDESHDDDEAPGLKDGINEDAQVVEKDNSLSIMDNAPNVQALKEDNVGNKNEDVIVNGIDAAVNEDDTVVRGDSPEKEVPNDNKKKEDCVIDVDTPKSNKRKTTEHDYNDYISKYGDTPNRGSIRSEVFRSSVAQAKQVNKRRAKWTKEELAVSDICNIEMEGNIRGATGAKYLPVAIMEVLKTASGNTAYKVATKHGYLMKNYQRHQLHYMPLLTKELLSIDETNEKVFSVKLLSEQTAVSLYNIAGVSGKCKCKTDCGAPGSKCSCKNKGIFCTSKCHGGRGTKGEKKCSLIPPLSGYYCKPCEM